MHWWTEQLLIWQEILLGIVMLALGLYLEDLIDRRRAGKVSKQIDRGIALWRAKHKK